MKSQDKSQDKNQSSEYQAIIDMVSANKIPLLIAGGGIAIIFSKLLAVGSVLSLIGWLGGKVSRRLEERRSS